MRSHLIVKLDTERTAWLLAEAARLGVSADPQQVVEALIDAARSAGTNQTHRKR